MIKITQRSGPVSSVKLIIACKPLIHTTLGFFDKQETGQRRKTSIAIEILQSLKNKALLIVNNHYS